MIRNVVMIGAAGTLGRKLLSEFGKDNLILFDRNDIEELPEHCSLIRGNAEDIKDMQVLCNYIKEQEIKIDVLLYLAGIYRRGTVEELSLKDWQESIDTNITGLFITLKLLMDSLNTSGKIIAVASQFGIVGAYESAAYCATKAAMINLIRAVALDYGSKKIQANCVCPGFFDSPFLQYVESGTRKKREWMSVTSMLPMSRVSIDDIVNAIKMLSINNSITGQCIVIDGGYTSR